MLYNIYVCVLCSLGPEKKEITSIFYVSLELCAVWRGNKMWERRKKEELMTNLRYCPIKIIIKTWI